ncbi:MAG TPA: outer membrane beta-barrel protein, partial [Pyrinomonadaceae bacterium]
MRSRNLLITFALLVLAPCAAHAQTQTDEYKSEIGGLFTAINLASFDATVNGLGGRIGYNFNDHFALDAEASFFPETHLGNEQIGQKAQAFVGLKAGARTKHVGLFAKARPGVMFIGEFTTGFNCSSSTSLTICRPKHNNFALDAGGVFEFYPSARTIIRLDAGDTIIRERQTTRGVFTPAPTTNATTHN